MKFNIKARALAALRRLQEPHIIWVSGRVTAQTRQLRTRWTLEDFGPLEWPATVEPEAEPQLQRMLLRYARAKLNKRYYGKVVICGTRNPKKKSAARFAARKRSQEKVNRR